MKYLLSHVTSMKNNPITIDLVSGITKNVTVNSIHDGYHDFFEMEFFLEGDGMHYLNAIPYQIKPGYIYLLPPGDCHRVQIPTGIKIHFYNLKFTLAASNPELMQEIGKYSGPYSIYLPPEQISFLEQEFRLLYACLQEQKYPASLAKNIVERICIMFLEHLKNDSRDISHTPVDRRIFLIFEYIEKNYTHTISFSELAKAVELSENYLGIFFKKHTGKKLSDYIHLRRIYHAIRLLGNTNMSIKEVAYRTGFCSPEYMARIFKLHSFPSPKSYQNW